MIARYDEIGKSYAQGRVTDPEIARQFAPYLEGAESILNLGAGAGSYEPEHSSLIALDPSITMLKQRPAGSAPAVRAEAEQLPFGDKCFSHCMTFLSMHHWQDRESAFSEIARVCRERFVAVSWDPLSEPFWLTRDYFPEMYGHDRLNFPSLDDFRKCFTRVESIPLMIPAACVDGFLAAFWRRPEAYLDSAVRSRMSGFDKLRCLEEGLGRLRSDLDSGNWAARNQELLDQKSWDAGYRIFVVELG